MNISYNAKHLRKASSNDIQPELIYQAIQELFPDQTPVLARRTIVAEKFQWSIPTAAGEVWTVLGDATPEERSIVLSELTRYKDLVASRLQLSSDIVNAIFTTPDDDKCIYYSITDGHVRISIVAWDFTSAGNSTGPTVITKDNLKLKQAVKLIFTKDGKPFGGFTIVASLKDGSIKKWQVPLNGVLSLGDLLVNLEIHLDLSNVNKSYDLIIEKGKEIYEFDLTEPKIEPEQEIDIVPEPEKVNATLVVINQDGNPVAQFSVDITYPDGSNEHATTDADGEKLLKSMAVGESFDVIDSTSGKSTNFTIDADKVKYYLRIEESKQQPEIEPEPQIVNPVLVVINQDGNPVAQFPVDITYPDGSSEHTSTDNDGKKALKSMTVGESFRVIDPNSGASVIFTIEADKDTYYLRIEESVPEPEIINPTLVVINQDGNPVAQFPVDITYPDGSSERTSTDNDGKKSLKSMTVGESFRVIDPNSGASVIFTIEADKDTYYLRIEESVPEPEIINPTLIVIDQKGNPVAQFPIDITFPDGSGEHSFTDAAGQKVLKPMAVGETFSVADSFSGASKAITIEADKDTYYFQLDYVPSNQDFDITIKVIDEKEKPIHPGRISLSQNSSVILIDLPENATFGLSRGTFATETPIKVKLVDSNQKEYNSTEFKLVEGETQYIIQLDSANCPKWKIVAEIFSILGIAAASIAAYPYLWDIMKDLVLKTY